MTNQKLKTMFVIFAMLASAAQATTIYFDDGTAYDLQPGESVYVSSGRLWEFTVFNPLDMRIEAVEPLEYEPLEDEGSDDCLTFGGGSCVYEEEVDVDVILETISGRFEGVYHGGK